jgi:iron-sulfur cluster assembly accessory protein
MSKAIITFSEMAAQKLGSMIKGSNSGNALFYVKGGGCSGLKYVLEPTNEKPSKFDEIVPISDSKNLHVCGKSLIHLLGTHIDWKEDFMGQSFQFTNPNANVKCGCGSTFS